MYYLVLRRDGSLLPPDAFDNHEFPHARRNPFCEFPGDWADTCMWAIMRGPTYLPMTLQPESLEPWQAEILKDTLSFARKNADAIYTGMVIGTVIFSAAGGFGEVLGSPVIAAIPAKDPDREMSKLHSVYAWGVVFVILFATLFLLLFGRENWQILTLIFTVVPLISFFLYVGAEIPPMETPEKVSGALAYLKNKTLWLSVFGIFLGGSAECTMAQWSSGYLEQALGIPKVWGDMFGVAMFGLMLGLGRTLYAKCGRRIGHVLFLGAIGASVCYLLAAVTNISVLGLAACAFTGFCTSMLWPGSLIAATDRIPDSGVFIYAMMAAGGDLGASVGPQLVGIVTDAVIASPSMTALAETMALAPEQLGMKMGMLVGMLFPLAAISVFWNIRKSYPKEK